MGVLIKEQAWMTKYNRTLLLEYARVFDCIQIDFRTTNKDI